MNVYRALLLALCALLISGTHGLRLGKSSRQRIVQIKKFVRKIQSLRNSLKLLKNELDLIKNNTNVTPSLQVYDTRTPNISVIPMVTIAVNVTTTASSKSKVNFYPGAKGLLQNFRAAKLNSSSCAVMACKPNQVPILDKTGKVKKLNLKMVLSEVCGNKQFIIVNENLLANQLQSSYRDVWSQCCGLGVMPAVFSTEAERECFAYKFNQLRDDVRQRVDSSSLITAYLDADLNGTFLSCPGLERLPDRWWYSGQPDNTLGLEACVGVLANHENNTYFKDMTCSSGTFTLCQHMLNFTESFNRSATVPQGPRKTDTTLMTTPGFVFKIEKKNISKVNNDSRYDPAVVQMFQRANFNQSTCANLTCKPPARTPAFESSGGRLIKKIPGKIKFSCMCDKKHFAILEQLSMIQQIQKPNSYQSVWQRCCELGMEPAAFSDVGEMYCLWQEIKALPPATLEKLPAVLFTSYVDASLSGRFVSCPGPEPLPEDWWATSEPNNAARLEACAGMNWMLHVSVPAMMFDAPCTANFNVLCQYNIK